ncbi:hypothetical protein RIF29_39643 [Crotalaria pallida]|uniref:DUF7138 domain-containing protein n=1 Tax=Crotalaria pallida TaxID=3830 RepID=A0AAN9HPY9_CROPI
MVDGGGATFSVVYYDGEAETTIGNVTVDSSFNFNKFLSFLSHKIGISPHQFSVYLASYGSNRKIPITAKVNFAAILRDTAGAASSFFFVKRSKRPRRNKVRNNSKGFGNNENNGFNIANPPANVVLLRRNAAAIATSPFAMSPVMSRFEYEKRMMDLQMQRERYLMSMGIGDLCFDERETPNANATAAGSGVGGGGFGGGVICEECLTGMDGGFHQCVYDAVTVGFRSPAGPVARPVRGTG